MNKLQMAKSSNHIAQLLQGAHSAGARRGMVTLAAPGDKASTLNPRTVWAGRDFKDHLVPTPRHRQEHLPLGTGSLP